ncbi:MAG TPA: RND family transporter [Cyclobacteriaceae bacterium]
MWTFLARNILKFRLPLLILLLIITGYMGYQAQFVEYSFDLANIVPEDDPEMVYFKHFKETFGEDGNIMAIGLRDSSLYEYENFRKFKYLTDEIQRLKGINEVLALSNIKSLKKNTEEQRFEIEEVFKDVPSDQEALDSLLAFSNNLKFYSGQLINSTNGATLILITINKEVVNSEQRNTLVQDILFAGNAFEEVTGIDLRYAGLPYVRTITTTRVKSEMNFFLAASVVVTGIILFLFFRSFKAVFFPLLIIGAIILWCLGLLSLFDFKITILTGLIPPIIVVIGIPNSVYMLNKYHQEYDRHGDKIKALSRIIRKIGVVTLITNCTTAVGFLVLTLTDIIILKEFGLIAGINILATFVVSIIFIPSVYSFLPPPETRHLKHLRFTILNKVLNGLDLLVHRHKSPIFILAGVVIIISIFGISKIEAVSFMVDDLPEKGDVKQDLAFFEENFAGIMPLEVIVDTKNKKGVQRLGNIKKLEELEAFLDSSEYISQPVSVVSFIKAAKQAFYNQNPAYYELPTNRERAFIFRYLKEDSDKTGISKSFVDSTGQRIRVSLKIADIGSKKMDSLVSTVIKPKINDLFADSKMDVKLTGTTLMFIKGNKFLIENLIQSMVIAFVIIAIIMALLFRNFRMIIISLIPNIIPLMITAGLMGYFSIPLKPSTALIFSIVFGISVDDSIHFLAKYRQELFTHNFFVPKAVSISLKETGASMIYTSIILFFGFVIFTASEFLGTVALGMLTSITLLLAMITNLVVLPALLLRFDSGKRDQTLHPLIERYPEFYHEDEDEEIDINLIEVKKSS